MGIQLTQFRQTLYLGDHRFQHGQAFRDRVAGKQPAAIEINCLEVQLVEIVGALIGLKSRTRRFLVLQKPKLDKISRRSLAFAQGRSFFCRKLQVFDCRRKFNNALAGRQGLLVFLLPFESLQARWCRRPGLLCGPVFP